MNIPRLLASALAALATTAGALDVVATQPPAQVADQQLTIGNRNLKLPAGNWTYAAGADGSMKMSGITKVAPHRTAYAMDVRDGKMAMAVSLRLPLNSAVVTGWNEEPCKVEGALFKDDFNSGFTYPQCLLVFKRRTHLSVASTDSLYGPAQQWVSSQAIKTGPVYEVFYVRFGSNDFGFVRVFVPTEQVADDAAIIAWAKQLQPSLQRLFENRDTQAALPALPAK